MLGVITEEELKCEYPDGIPMEYDPKQLPRLTREQVIFYDETHLEQEEGSTTTTGYQIRFPRDSEGRYSPLPPSNPRSIYAEKVTRTSFKYAGQSRLCLGVAAVKMLDGTEVGMKSRVFDYTGRGLIGLVEWRKRIQQEIDRVRNLQSTGR